MTNDPVTEHMAQALKNLVEADWMNLSEAMTIDLFNDAEIALNEYRETQSPIKLTPPSEVEIMNLSHDVVEAAHTYVYRIEQQESGEDDSGFTPKELDLIRTKYHNKFLEMCKKYNIDVSNRADTTELARRIARCPCTKENHA